MVTKCLATLQTILFSKTLQAGYALVQVSFTHSIPAYSFYLPPASLRHAPVTDLASLVTMHGHPLRGRVPSCFPSLLFSYTCKNKMLLCPGKLQPEERNVSQPKNTDCWKKMILEMVLTSMTGSWIRVRKPVLQ